MSGYIGTQPVPQATQTRDVFTATSGQTTFATSGYTPNFLDVWLNGVKLVNGDDFTATNGSDVVLTTGATAGDTVEVLSYSTYEVNAQTYTGGLTVNNDAATVLTVDRATSDGTLVDFKKDNTSVGSIRSENGYTKVVSGNGTAGSGLAFYNYTISPVNPNGNSSDNAIDLGASSNRFQNLYLSGGVYLGGTGAANLLDDYEEGTWTPRFDGQITDPTVTYGTQSGFYTKIGRFVHIYGRIKLTSKSGGNGFICLRGIPFSPVSSTGLYAAGSASYTGAWDTVPPVGLLLQHGSNFIEMYGFTGTSARSSMGAIINTDYLTNSSDLIFSLTYETA